MIVVMPHASRSATFQQSAPPAYDIIRSPLNSVASFAARLTVIACKGRPDRYIIFSFAENSWRWLITSSVFDSFTPNCTPFFAARVLRSVRIFSASGYFRSWPNASSGTVT